MSRRSLYRMESIYTDSVMGNNSHAGPNAGPPPGLINALILGVFYGYFALNLDSDADTCLANDEDDQRLADDAPMDSKNYSDIGSRYHLCFAALFFMTIIQATISFFAYSIGKTTGDYAAAEPVYKLAIFFYAMASLAEFVIWIYLIFTRFTHEGRVCSGDFLSNRTPP